MVGCLGWLYVYYSGEGYYPDDILGESAEVAVSAAGDVNGDGYGDVLVVGAGRTDILLGASYGLDSTPFWTLHNIYTPGLAGDVNGDGYSDVLLVRDQTYVFTGGPEMSTTPTWTLAYTQAALSTAGDIDGNGCADFILGNQQSDHVARVFQGYPTGAPVLVATLTYDDLFGGGVRTAGDVNGDGFSDIAILARAGTLIYHGAGATVYPVDPQWQTDPGLPGIECGRSVAPAGDVNGDGFSDVLIGMPGDHPFFGGGIVLSSYGSPGGPTTGWLEDGFPLGSGFGRSVASAGDVNGDGYSDAIVGAPGYDLPFPDQGMAFLYHGGPSGLSTTPAWTYTTNLANSELGYSVASAGDVNGDGYSDVIVGEPGYTPSETMPDAGRALVFLGSANGLGTSPSWSGVPAYDNARMGSSVASAGDVNGDGYSDVIVGNPTDWLYTPWAGRAHIWFGSATGVSTSGWGMEGDQQNEYFGSCVASVGDVNGDGFGDIAIGSPGYDNGMLTDEGAVRLYLGHPSGPSGGADGTYTGGFIREYFGTSVAGAGDLNGDGLSELIIGAPGANIFPYSAAGYARVFKGVPGGMPVLDGGASGAEDGANCGFSVASAGDCNGDGFSDVVIGVPGHSNGGPWAGLANIHFGNYPFSSPTQGLTLLPRQQRTGGEPLDFLGMSDSATEFRLACNGRSPGGRSRIWLEWNAAPLGTEFGSSNDGASGWLDTGEVGSGGSVTPMSTLVSNLSGTLPYRWRVRVASNSIYFPHSPWLKLPQQVPSLATVRIAAQPVAVEEDDTQIGPAGAALLFARPNPIRTTARIVFRVPEAQTVRLSVFDAAGRWVDDLLRGRVEAGEHAVVWDTRDSRGRPVGSGIFYGRLNGTDGERSIRLLVVR